MKALLLIDDGFEELSVYVPWFRLKEEGVDVTLSTPLMHAVQGQHGYTIEPDAPLRMVNSESFDLLLIPDGRATERLRLRSEAVDLARTFLESGRMVAAIGHGAQVLISAGTLDGRTVTCSPGIRDDVRMAGAVYRDDSTILDGNLLTARSPDELPEFCLRLIAMVKANRAIGVR